jgi:hypothetical protein
MCDRSPEALNYDEAATRAPAPGKPAQGFAIVCWLVSLAAVPAALRLVNGKIISTSAWRGVMIASELVWAMGAILAGAAVIFSAAGRGKVALALNLSFALGFGWLLVTCLSDRGPIHGP